MKLKRIIYFVILALSLVMISFYGGAISYGIFFSLVLIPFISYAYLIAEYLSFRIYQKLDGRNLVSGSSKDYYFILKNESYMTFSSISIRLFSTFSEIEELPEDTEFCLVKGEQFRYDTRLFCKYRGEYEVGIKEIVLTDFFRIFKLKYKMPGTIKALVSPCVEDLEAIDGLEEITLRMSMESMLRKDTPDTTVRDYVPGDSMRSINWKLSAKENSLKTRQYLSEEKQGILILTDTTRYSQNNKEYLPLEDQILKTLLAISNYFVKKNIPIRVVCEQSTIKTIDVNNNLQFDALYNVVSGMIFDTNHDFSKLIFETVSLGDVSTYDAVICILHELSDQAIERLIPLSSQGKHTVIYYVSDEYDQIEVSERLSNLRAGIVAVPLNKSLAEVLS